MRISEGLRAAKELIDRPEKWEKGALHCDGANGETTHCSLGACHIAMRAWDEPKYRCAYGFLSAAAQRAGSASITALNDTGTHKDVMEMFDRAIESAEGHGL